jgi:uncharacterized protein
MAAGERQLKLLVKLTELYVIHLSSQSVEKFTAFVGKSKLLIVDEAQTISNIGLNLKLIVDHLPGIHVVVTGSSSFDLASRLSQSCF